MTEDQWLENSSPEAMLAHLRSQASVRKLRLFGCACARHIEHLLDERSRAALAVIERCAQGQAGKRQLQAALAAVEAVEATTAGKARAAARAVGAAWSTVEHACSAAIQAADDPAAEHRRQANLLRDLFPFRPMPVDLTWLHWGDGLVERMARTIQEQRDFDALPVLADALQEAGCDDEAILGHCRSGVEHGPGCWLLDALVGAPVVGDAVDDELPAWTVGRPVEREGRCVRHLSGRDRFAVVTLRVEPGPSPVRFINAAPECGNAQAWVPAVEGGALQAVHAQAALGRRLDGVRILLTRLQDDPVDSSFSSFVEAAVLALTQAFEEPGVLVASP